MSTYKITYAMRGQGQGWSETWYRVNASLDLGVIYAEALLAAPKRAYLLGKEYELHAIRVSRWLDDSNAPVRRQAIVRRVSYPGNQQAPGGFANLALVVKCYDALRQRNKMVDLRGIWDGISVDGGVYDPNYLSFGTSLGNWAGQIAMNGYGWIGRTIGTTIYPLTNYVEGSTGIVTLTFTGSPFSAPEFGKSQVVNIRNLNGGLSQLNGDVVVLPQSTNIAKTKTLYGSIPFLSEGEMRKYTTTFIQSAIVEPSHIAQRKVGAPFLQRRGRARVSTRT